MTGVQTCALPICFPVTIIAEKYGSKELGLSPESKQTAYREIVKPDLVTGIKDAINGK